LPEIEEDVGSIFGGNSLFIVPILPLHRVEHPLPKPLLRVV
jgi:hypothetical protein